jgi:ATP-binding cassette subfamily F protein 3
MLVLDEPTNHLDVESREALEDALTGFPGSLLLVSHDRALLDAVGSRTFAIEDGTLRVYEGGWADYVQARKERKEAERRAPTSKPEKKARPRREKGPSKNAVRAQRELERRIEKAEAAMRALEDELADPSAWASPSSSARSSERHTHAKRELDELYAQLEKTEVSDPAR